MVPVSYGAGKEGIKQDRMLNVFEFIFPLPDTCPNLQRACCSRKTERILQQIGFDCNVDGCLVTGSLWKHFTPSLQTSTLSGEKKWPKKEKCVCPELQTLVGFPEHVDTILD